MKRSQMKQQGEDRDLGRAKLFFHTFFSVSLFICPLWWCYCATVSQLEQAG